jgi:AcrR family transcriptional regulator
MDNSKDLSEKVTQRAMCHIKEIAHNKKTNLTRSWIFESLMLLMDKKPYGKITVSDITQKAGIARQTFYRSYANKDAVLFEYFRGMVNADLLKIENIIKGSPDTIVLMYNYAYMCTQRERIKKILVCCNFLTDFVSKFALAVDELLVPIIESYRGAFSPEDFLLFRYKLKHDITGCFQVFHDWFLNDSPLPVEQIVSMLNSMNAFKIGRRRNIPNILVRINEE